MLDFEYKILSVIGTFGKCLKCSLTTTLLIRLQVDVARNKVIAYDD